MTRNPLRDALLGLFMLAIGAILSGILLWSFALLGKNFFPGVLTFALQSVSVITLASFFIGLIFLTAFNPDLYQSFLAEMVLFVALALGVLLSSPFLGQYTTDILSFPVPTTGRFTETVEGSLFWENSGGAILHSRTTDQILVFDRADFDTAHQRFLTSPQTPDADLRWIGHSDKYFLPPGSLSDFIDDLQVIANVLEKNLDSPNNLPNLAVFLLGFFSLIAMCRSLALLHFPRIITTIAAIIFLRLGIALIRFAWFEAPQILANWQTELDPGFTWLYTGWMPAGLGFCLLFLSIYQQSISSGGDEADGAAV